jgi:hypothetical protein
MVCEWCAADVIGNSVVVCSTLRFARPLHAHEMNPRQSELKGSQLQTCQNFGLSLPSGGCAKIFIMDMRKTHKKLHNSIRYGHIEIHNYRNESVGTRLVA